MDALQRAFTNADRMRTNFAKSSGSRSVSSVVNAGRGIGGTINTVNTAREQLSHFKGWVWSAVRLIATRIAGQPIHVARKPAGPKHGKGIGDSLEPLDSHALLETLADPSELYTGWSLKFVTICSLELTGRALWWVTEDNGRRVILHIPTHWIRKVDARRTVWTIRPDGSPDDFDIPGNEVVHFFYPDPSDPLGCISPLSRIAEAVVADEEIAQAQWSAFKNGIFPKVILTAGRLPDTNGIPGERPSLTQEQREDLIGAIKAVYRGTLKTDEPFIIDGLIENITKLSNSIAEMDFLDSSKLTKSKVLQGFGVSPILLGEVEGANRASATVADEIFTSNKVNPLCEMLSQAMSLWLGPLFAGSNEKLLVWIQSAVAHDPELQLKRWELASKLGFVNGDEFRRHMLNLPDAGLTDYQTPAMMLPRTQRSFRVNGNVDPYTLERLSGSAH